MPKSGASYDIYLELGQKKVFAVAVDWPGWCRSGQDEDSAIQALLEAGTRYLQVLQRVDLEFKVPPASSAFNIVERLKGNATTDFGAPDGFLPGDWDAIDRPERERLEILIKAGWLAFDTAVSLAEDKELRKGPRGGGRELSGILAHVVGAEEGYLGALGWKMETKPAEEIDQRIEQVRAEVIRGLRVAASGQLPRRGPKGGKRWPPRFFVRRLAWHVIDHAWEIEDRVM